MTGLDLMNRLMDPAARDTTMTDHTYAVAPAPEQAAQEAPVRVTEARSRKVRAGHSDSGRALSRPQSSRRAASRRNLELH